jgi:hypothetical protein
MEGGSTMDIITQAVLENDLPDIQEYKVELPQFPLWWLEKGKRNMEGLREIASHLHGKTEGVRVSRQGFKGDASEMDKQIIRNVIDLEQQVGALTDVLQAVIQIVVEEHEGKPSQRIKRAATSTWHKAARYGNRLWNNPVFKICGGLSTLAFVGGAILWIIRSFGK